MPNYCFLCNDCHYKFEDYCSMSKIQEFNTDCPQCFSKNVGRDFKSEKTSGYSAIRTVGALADRNTEKKSSDELASIKERNFSYLKNRPQDPFVKRRV